MLFNRICMMELNKAKEFSVMRVVRSSCVAAALAVGLGLTAVPDVARADLVLFNNGNGSVTCDANCASFSNLNGSGFGAYPRIMTLQTSTSESGQVAPNGSGGVTYPTTTYNPNQAIQNGTDKGSAPTLTSLGWANGSQVGIGFVANQVGQTGITLQSLSVTLYDGTSLMGTFSLASPINYTAADLALQPGNGNAVFTFVLNGTEQTAWNSLVSADPTGMWAIGLLSSLGCAVTPSASCQVSNDGPDSFIAIAAAGAPSLVPLPAALPLFASGLAGLGLLGWRRKRKAQAAA